MVKKLRIEIGSKTWSTIRIYGEDGSYGEESVYSTLFLYILKHGPIVEVELSMEKLEGFQEVFYSSPYLSFEGNSFEDCENYEKCVLVCSELFLLYTGLPLGDSRSICVEGTFYMKIKTIAR